MYKIEYWNPDGTGFSETKPWVSEPVSEDQLEGILEKLKDKGCNVVNVIDVGENFSFTQKEIQMLHAACMSYGDKLSEIIKSIPNEETDQLSDRAKESWSLARKIAEYMDSDHT